MDVCRGNKCRFWSNLRWSGFRFFLSNQKQLQARALASTVRNGNRQASMRMAQWTYVMLLSNSRRKSRTHSIFGDRVSSSTGTYSLSDSPDLHVAFWLSLTLSTCTVEAPVSGHPREAEKLSETGTGRLRDCVNTEFVYWWARVQTGFFFKAAVSMVSRAVRLR